MDRLIIDVSAGTAQTVSMTAEEAAAEEARIALHNAGAAAREAARIEQLRFQAYTKESDPLFFKWQRGEGTEQAWLDKVAEIKQRYPE